MRAMLTALTLALALPVAGCDTGAEAEAGAEATVPLTIAMAVTTHRFRVEVARTEAEQEKGLMFRTSLPADGGMLFPFAKPKIANFWMKNTLIPLDMIFVRADGSIDRIAENAIPESLDPVGSDRGPVNALSRALAKDLGPLQPYIADMKLVDFKVRITNGGVEAVTRVVIDSEDAMGHRWSTVGVSPNIVDASFEALLEAIQWKLVRDDAPVPGA